MNKPSAADALRLAIPEACPLRVAEFEAYMEAPTVLTAEHVQRVADYNRSRPRYMDVTMRDGRVVKARLI